MDPIKGIKRRIKYYKSDDRKYRDLWYSCTVDEHSMLIEPGRGETVSGNMFALLKEVETDPQWASYTPYFVVTEKTRAEAALKFEYYGFKKVRTVTRMSADYLRLLASCKYFFTDNTYPSIFCKKPDQILVSTWHGTPLKHMGKADLEGARGIGNVQRNFFMADYALFPNDFTRDVFMDDYLLRAQFAGQTVMLDYPRSDAFFDDAMRQKVRREQGIEGKRIYAYMPTWRGGDARNVSMESQLEEIAGYLQRFDSALSDDELLYVNLHPFVGSRLSYDGYRHIKPFPAEYETYDFLNVSDALVTDYSSVFFDYAQTRRRVVLFTYDLEDYMASRGMYMDVADLPFAICREPETVVEALRGGADGTGADSMQAGGSSDSRKTTAVCDSERSDTAAGDPERLEDFLNTYCRYRDPDGKGCANALLSIVTGGAATAAGACEDEKAATEACARKSGKSESETAGKSNAARTGDDGAACTGAGRSASAFCRVEPLPDDGRSRHVIAACNIENGLTDDVRRSIKRHTDEGAHVSVLFDGGIKPEKLDALRELDAMEGVSWYSLIGGIRDDDMPREVRRFFPGWRIDSMETTKGMKRNYYRLARHLMPVRSYSLKDCGDSIRISFRQKRLSYLEYAKLGDHEYELARSGDRYSITIPKQDLSGYIYRNQITLVDDEGRELKIISASRLRKILKIIHTKVIRVGVAGNQADDDQVSSGSGVICYLQEYLGRTDLLVRPVNYTDSAKERIKIGVAYILAALSRGGKTPVLLFEKNSERFEESASVLYMKLLDMGYTNVYYVLRRGCPAWDAVPDKYRSHLTAKYSFGHYLKLFRCRTFMATERITHNIDLRPLSPFLRYWLKHAGYNYVFLQHGVMYMVSLDAERRAFFKMEERPGYLNRTVVSSELEADHFVYRGGYDRGDLYVCGLLKFDGAFRYDVHDRIVIMPTWRPGEAIQAAEDFRETSYYKFISRIYRAIPDGLKDRVIVLPHPLIKKSAVEAMESGADDELMKLMLPDHTHEEVLRMTDTLITDYSSISYDAFYRGANVIFDWEEKDETIAFYGQSARLMLTEDLAFGEVVYTDDGLRDAVAKVYGHPHAAEFEERFGKLVEYHDGRNTERFIEMAGKDGLL